MKKIILKVPGKKEPLQLDLVPISAYINSKIREIELKVNDMMKADYVEIVKDRATLNKYFGISSDIMFELLKSGVDIEGAEESAEKEPTNKPKLSQEALAIYKPIYDNIQKMIIAKHKDIETLEICKALIDTSLLNEENAGYIKSDTADEFWQMQSLSEVKKAVDYFRGC